MVIGTIQSCQIVKVNYGQALSLQYEANGSSISRTLLYFPGGIGATFQVYNQGVLDVLHLNPDGNVGIGTTDPKNKLSVNGIIWAKEVKVSLADAADWVFEDDYELRSLEEVESFVKSNKHLPDIPSADEFRENDLNVAEMDNMLLQKVEELTLYLIEQNKRIKDLEQRIAE